MRRATRIDSNHGGVVSLLRKAGFSVLSLAALGKGCPDLLAARNGLNWLIEIKDGTKPPSQRKLTPDQVRFHANWQTLIIVINSATDLRAFIKVSP